MKKLIILMFLFFSPFVYANDLSLLGKEICLDAGHGGKDSGAISHTIIEKDMNLILTHKLEKSLSKKGAIVYLTRNTDKDLSTTTVNRKRSDLQERANFINSSSCTIYISIHLNSSNNSKWRGIQIFYDSNNKENEILADYLYNNLNTNNFILRKNKEANDYYMYSRIKKIGVLIEAGFISNKEDNYLLRQPSYQNKLIKKLTEGIEFYLNN